MTILNKRKMKHLSKLALLAAAFFTGLSANAQSINAWGGQSQTISSDQTCTGFSVLDGSTLTVNQGVTLTLNISNGNNFQLFDNSTMQLHGTLAGSVASGATWMDNTYINVYLSDGAKYTVTGLECMDGDDYLRYHGYDAATDGHGTVSVTNGSTAVTASSIGYKTTTYTFTATPASGYRFVNWTKGAGGEELGTAASINVTCEQNGQYQVYANFEEDVPAGPQMRTLTGVPQGWQVQAGDPLADVDSNADGSYSIAAGQPVLVVPSAEDKPRVKSVVLVDNSTPAWNTVDLSTLTADYVAQDNDLLTGTLGGNVKISIADGATVTLDGVTINGEGSSRWAGITCLGDATIILSGTNTVKGFYDEYPGIYVPVDKTVTIEGSGSLTASSSGYACGIGGGWRIACGNIVIAGGTITATGGNGAAGIGSGNEGSCGTISITGGTITATGGDSGAGIGSGNGGSCGNISITGGTVNATGGYSGAGIGSGHQNSCGNISITGGTVTATGGEYAAGIGGGDRGSCGTVTITGGVTSVTATKGEGAQHSIGAGDNGSCGTVTIGGTVGEITTSPYKYTPGN